MTIYIRQLALSMLAATAVTASAITLPDLPDHDGMAIKGYVHDGTNTLAGVHVTDGYSIVTTGADGSYYIPSNDAAEMVYVIVPSGYNPECADGISRFWLPIQKGEASMQADFVLTPTGDDTHHTMLVLGDPQMRDDHDHLYWEFAQTDYMAVRQGDWKLIVKDGIPALYDLATDLHEDHDISRQHPDVTARLIDIIYSEHRPSQLFKVTLPERIH